MWWWLVVVFNWKILEGIETWNGYFKNNKIILCRGMGNFIVDSEGRFTSFKVGQTKPRKVKWYVWGACFSG